MSERTGRVRVVVADDSDVIRGHLVDLLSPLPQVEAIHETDGVERTLAAVHAIRPEVVVLDIQMPDGSGLHALQHIKRHYPDTLVIMLTNHATPFYRQSCLNAGAAFFFDKSTQFEEVARVIGDLGRDREPAV